jgi:hypothetical protein
VGFMDSLRSTAQDVATEARKATARGKTKVEELALRRKLDDRARQLGYLVFRERTQGTPAGADADALVAEMRELEDQIARNALEATPEGGESPAPEAAATDEGKGIEGTPEGAPPAQSPPEGHPTDQPSS